MLFRSRHPGRGRRHQPLQGTAQGRQFAGLCLGADTAFGFLLGHQSLIVGGSDGSVQVYFRLARKDAATYELPYGTFLGIAALAVSYLSASLP
mgnify:CR=1 FL=1